MHVADLDPLWACHPSPDNHTCWLLLCETQQKDVLKLAKSIEAHPHSAGELWIVAVICDEGTWLVALTLWLLQLRADLVLV